MRSRDLLTPPPARGGLPRDPPRPPGRGRGLDADALRARLALRLPDGPTDPRTLLDELVDAATPGIVAAGRRATSATSSVGPSRGAHRRHRGRLGPERRRLPVSRGIGRGGGHRRLRSICWLPAGASFGLTTGCQQAHVTCLAAARNASWGRVGWDVEAGGLQGAPRCGSSSARSAT